MCICLCIKGLKVCCLSTRTLCWLKNKNIITLFKFRISSSIASESSYILIAEYSIFLLVAWAAVLLKSKAGTFVLLYTSHVVSCTVCYLSIIILVIMSRLADIKSSHKNGHFTRSLLEATMYFNLLISISFVLFIVIVWSAVESDIAQDSNLFFLVLQSSIYTAENEYLLKVGGILAICLVVMLSIIFFFTATTFCRSTMKEENGPGFVVWTGELLIGFSVLSIFIQASLCKYMERACGLTDGSRCTMQYIAQDKSLSGDYLGRYQFSLLYIAVFFLEFYVETFIYLLTLPFQATFSGVGILTRIQGYFPNMQLTLHHFSNLLILILNWLFSMKIIACYNSCFLTLNMTTSFVLSIHILFNLTDTVRSMRDRARVHPSLEEAKTMESSIYSLYHKKSYVGTKQTNRKILSIKLKKT